MHYHYSIQYLFGYTNGFCSCCNVYKLKIDRIRDVAIYKSSGNIISFMTYF
jgi:hypothetical protein